MKENHMEEKEFNLEQMEKETEEMLKTNIIKPGDAVFKATEGGFVSMKYGDKDYPRVRVVRMFPFTDPEHFISVRTNEERSKEIGIIEDMKALDKDTYQVLRKQLDVRYFTPIILKVLKVKDRRGFAYFDVVTDKGVCKFTIHMGGGDVVHLSETRIILNDLDENRFEIPDVTKLTTKERKKLDLFL